MQMNIHQCLGKLTIKDTTFLFQKDFFAISFLLGRKGDEKRPAYLTISVDRQDLCKINSYKLNRELLQQHPLAIYNIKSTFYSI